jgi:hypothetical protein
MTSAHQAKKVAIMPAMPRPKTHLPFGPKKSSFMNMTRPKNITSAEIDPISGQMLGFTR